MLLLAVVGVSVAQESRIFAGGPNSDEPSGSTTPEQTSFEATGAEDTTSPPPSASSEPEDRLNIPEPTVGENEKPTAAPPGEVTSTPGTNDVGKPVNSGRGGGKPEHAGKASDVSNSRDDDVGDHGNGKPGERGNTEEPGRGVGGRKVTLCHKGNKTLTVGAPALAGHLRHGDTRSACQRQVSGPEPSGETMEPEAAKNDGGSGSGGLDKVVLCHKDKNTITVGAPAQEAHLRHGDSLGACR